MRKSKLSCNPKELDSKETVASTEREKWMQKRKGYQTEATKWDKESEIAEQNRIKYDKLKTKICVGSLQ